MRWIVLLGLFCCDVATSWEIQHLEVNREGEGLQIEASVFIDAPSDLIYEALTDFDNLHQLSKGIKKSHLVPDTVDLEVFTRRRSCFLLLCFTSEVVETVTYPEPGVIVSTIVPSKSDFKSGVMRWRIVADGKGSTMHYDASMVPDFWIPRVIGSGAIRRTMKKQLKQMSSTLETRAQKSK